MLALSALTFGGCLTPFRPPPDAAHIQLTRAASPSVDVDKIWLGRDSGGLFVTGYVIRQLRASNTTNTHLDITVFDPSGGVLAQSVEPFEPAQIPQHRRPTGVSRYRAYLTPAVAAISRVEVKAHDGAHSANQVLP